jgi:uncharacterized iron-regulated protein
LRLIDINIMKFNFIRFYLLLILSFLVSGMVYAQNKPAYVLYDGKGRKVSYQKMLNDFKKADVILFGEFHDNPISHWLQLELTMDLNALYQLKLGAEMMEADNQEALNAYMKGILDYKGLDSAARLWNNFKTDYKPLVDFAKDTGITFTATNVPRRYARMVSKGGFEALDTLPEMEKGWIAPLPIPFNADLPRYQNMLTMMGAHGSPNIVKAQAIKDATMAHFILQNIPARKKWSGKRPNKFLHYNGAYHSDFYEGIMWYLLQANKNLNVKTITTITVADPNKFPKESLGQADFIICVDEHMTRTY